MKVGVLRLGHRVGRDSRITTHFFLIARAFGASFGILTGDEDRSVLEGIEKVAKSWGGGFSISHSMGWRKSVKEWKAKGGVVVHLTAYGLPVQEAIGKIRQEGKDLLVVGGGAKVPGEMYHLADWNVSVTSQPHSECAALAIFLDRLFEGKELELKFQDAKIRVEPNQRGKTVIRLP